MKRLYSSFTLIIIGALIAKTQIIFGDGCQGLSEAIISIFLCIIYILLLTMLLTISAIKYFRKKDKFNYYPLLATLFVLIFLYLIMFQTDKFESATTLYAKENSSSHIPGQCSLTLRENQTYKIKIQEIDWTCFYKGDYKISGDTLKLLRKDIKLKTDSLFTDKYLIDKNRKILLPLDNLQDTIRRLTITEYKE